jgi:hypothetical protein
VELSHYLAVFSAIMEAGSMNQMRRPWTGEDNDKIRNLAGEVSPAEMARRLNRTEAATRAQASKLRIALKSPANGVRHTVNKRLVHPTVSAVEQVVAPAAIERALSIYQQLQKRDQSVVAQARKSLLSISMEWLIRESATSSG